MHFDGISILTKVSNQIRIPKDNGVITYVVHTMNGHIFTNLQTLNQHRAIHQTKCPCVVNDLIGCGSCAFCKRIRPTTTKNQSIESRIEHERIRNNTQSNNHLAHVSSHKSSIFGPSSLSCKLRFTSQHRQTAYTLYNILIGYRPFNTRSIII